MEINLITVSADNVLMMFRISAVRMAHSLERERGITEWILSQAADVISYPHHTFLDTTVLLVHKDNLLLQPGVQ